MDKRNKDIRIFWFGVLPALFFQLVGAYIYFVAYANTEFAKYAYLLVKILILVWPFVWFLVGFKTGKFASKRFRKIFALGALSGILIMALVLGVYFLFRSYFDAFADLILEKVLNFGLENHFILFAILFSVFHSLLEEYYWRWFVMRGLMIKMKFGLAALFSSMAFASHHFIILSQYFNTLVTVVFGFAVMIGGLLWAYLYRESSSILPGWISHFFVDLAILSVGYLMIFQ